MTATVKRYFITDPETGTRILEAIRTRLDVDRRLSCRLFMRRHFGNTPTDYVKEDVEYSAYACLSQNAGDRGTVGLYSLVHDTGEVKAQLFTVLIDLPRAEDQAFVTELIDFLDRFEFVPFYRLLRPRPIGPVSCPGYLDMLIDAGAIVQWLRGQSLLPLAA